MAALTTTGTNPSGLSKNLHSYYERKLLETLEPRLVLYPLGMKQRMPKGMGKDIKWLRYGSVSESTTPLSEAVVPSEIDVESNTFTSQIKQYGQYSKVSDLLVDTAIDPVLKSLSERFGLAASKTIEALIIAELDASAAIRRVNGQANDAAMTSADVLNHKELIRAMVAQKKEFVGPHESGSYVAVLHPFMEYDLKSDSQAGSWLDVSKYNNEQQILRGEFGRMYGMKLLVSDKMSSIAAGVDDPNESGTSLAGVSLYNNYVIGEEAFGVVELERESVRMIIKPHGSAGVNDPLDQIATVGYKIHGFAVKYFGSTDSGNSAKRVIRIKAASALS